MSSKVQNGMEQVYEEASDTARTINSIMMDDNEDDMLVSQLNMDISNQYVFFL